MTVEQKLAFQEASSAGLKSMEHFIRLISHEPIHVDCREITNDAVSKFKKAISTLDRTGHARFRRGPVQVPDAFTSLCLSPNYMEKDTLAPAPLSVAAPVDSFTSLCLSSYMEKETLAPAPFFIRAPVQTALTLDFTKPNVNYAVAFDKMENPKSSSSFLSSITTGEGSVSNGKQVGSSSPMLLLPVAQAFSAGKQLSATGKRCREHENSDDVSGKSSGSGKCNCKKRKFRPRKVIRIPAISSRIADIPADEFSWRKYGQKPIKGSAYPRGYYKCSSVRGCPARKHVERAMDDPAMLIVTYEDEHRHTQVAMQENNSQMVAFGSTEEKKE